MSALTSVVGGDHLAAEKVRSYRAAFESTPARFVVLEDFLQPALAERLSRFLDHEARYKTEYGLYGFDEGVNEQEWNAAAEDERFFRFSKLVGMDPTHAMGDNALSYLQFRSTFQQNAELRAFFESITGMRLGASDDFGSHSMQAGDFLKAHDDDNNDRVLALVLYLSPDWRPEYGGTLKIVDPGGAELTVQARYNSLVVFDTRAGTTHYVVPISERAGERKRLTIGGWYHAPSPT